MRTLPASAAPTSPRPICDQASTRRSTASVSFSPAAREHLDAVVFERVVRGGDHDADVEGVGAASGRPRPASGPRRRSPPSRPRSREPRASACSIHVTRLTRVAAHQHPHRCLRCRPRRANAHEGRTNARHRRFDRAALRPRCRECHPSRIVSLLHRCDRHRHRRGLRRPDATVGIGHADRHHLLHRLRTIAASTIGSVIASRSCFERALRAGHFDRLGLRPSRSTTSKPCAGLPVDRRLHPHRSEYPSSRTPSSASRETPGRSRCHTAPSPGRSAGGTTAARFARSAGRSPSTSRPRPCGSACPRSRAPAPRRYPEDCSTISSSAGRFWNSMGTRSTRSTTRSPATTSHSSAAMQIDSNFSPRLRKENARHHAALPPAAARWAGAA